MAKSHRDKGNTSRVNCSHPALCPGGSHHERKRPWGLAIVTVTRACFSGAVRFFTFLCLSLLICKMKLMVTSTL
jgi:hypothetical protein